MGTNERGRLRGLREDTAIQGEGKRVNVQDAFRPIRIRQANWTSSSLTQLRQAGGSPVNRIAEFFEMGYRASKHFSKGRDRMTDATHVLSY